MSANRILLVGPDNWRLCGVRETVGSHHSQLQNYGRYHLKHNLFYVWQKLDIRLRLYQYLLPINKFIVLSKGYISNNDFSF
jgi:hypothetical protein